LARPQFRDRRSKPTEGWMAFFDNQKALGVAADNVGAPLRDRLSGRFVRPLPAPPLP